MRWTPYVLSLCSLLPGAPPSLSLICLSRGRLVPVVSHPPLSWELTVLLSIQLLREGFPLIALGVLLAFDCLLRISELLRLAPEDVVFPGDCRLGVPIDRAMLRLKVTKTGKNQWVPISNPVVVRWLRAVLIRCQSTARLFPFSSSLFRRLFKATVAKLRLPTSIVPHSLRHGGATRLHLSGLPLEDILLRGRWAASKSARTYIQAGKALLLDLNVEGPVAQLASVLAGDLEHTFRMLHFDVDNAQFLSSPQLKHLFG